MEIIRRYRLDDRYPWIRNLCQLYEAGELGEEDAELFYYQMIPLAEQQERKPNYLARLLSREDIYHHGPPDLIIGRSAEDADIPVGVFLKSASHCIMAGTTGSGKTVAIRRLIMAVAEWNATQSKPIVMIILDRKGGDYADLPGLFGERWRHYDVHGALRLGLQNPIGVPSDVWVNNLANTFSTRAGLAASWVTLANTLRWLVGVMNTGAEEQLLFPDFDLLIEVSDRLPQTAFSDKTQYQQSVVQQLRGISLASGEMFKAFAGLDVERDLVDKGLNAVISMPNIDPPWISRFLVDLILSQVLLSRIHRAHRVDSTEVLLILDEADEDVSYAQEASFPQGGLSPITKVLRQGREFGIGVVIGVGSLGPVCQQILNSMSHELFFRMNDAHCRVAAARTLQLPPGADAIIPALEPGECLVRTPAWAQALLANIDYVAPCRNAQPRFDANQHVPAKRLDKMPHVVEAIENKGAAHRERQRVRQHQKHAGLRSAARTLLYQASCHPYWPVARLYELIERPTPRMQKAIRQELEDAKYASFAEPRLGSRNVLLIELEDAAWSVLGKPPVPLRGRGSLPHRIFSNWIRMAGEKRGYESVCEWLVPGTNHPADAMWIVDGRPHVFEVIVTATDNVEDHLRAAFFTPGEPVETVTLVAPQKSMLADLRMQIQKCHKLAPYLERIAYAPVSVYEKELWP